MVVVLQKNVDRLSPVVYCYFYEGSEQGS